MPLHRSQALRLLQPTHIVYTLLLILNIIALKPIIEEESLPDQHPRSQKPHRIENHKRPELVSTLATNLVDKFLQWG